MLFSIVHVSIDCSNHGYAVRVSLLDVVLLSKSFEPDQLLIQLAGSIVNAGKGRDDGEVDVIIGLDVLSNGVHKVRALDQGLVVGAAGKSVH